MKIKVIHEGEEAPNLYTPEEFEKAMNVRYLPCLEFSSEKLKREVSKKAEAALEERAISRRQKWLGIYYAEELARGHSPDLLIKWIDPILGYGIFAGQKFMPGDFVSTYTGIVGKHSIFRRIGGNYLFYYPIANNKNSRYYVDAEGYGNYARYINHSSNGNVEPSYVLSGGVIHVILLAKKIIPIGTQICYDYGDIYWKKRGKPLRIDT